MIVLNLLSALIITEIIEVIAAFLLGYRERKFFAALLIINIITNPLLNCVLLLLYSFKLYHFIITPMLEVLVVISEWRLFKFALGNTKKNLLFLSIIINLCSYLIGLLFL